MKTLLRFILLSAVCGTVGHGKVICAHGLAVDLPPGWESLHLGSDYCGVGAYCDAGVVELLIERMPFDEKTRTADLDRQLVSGKTTESLEGFGRYRGHGIKRSGLTAEGESMSYVLFYPSHPAERIAILVIWGEASKRQLAEMEAILNSLREEPCKRH